MIDGGNFRKCALPLASLAMLAVAAAAHAQPDAKAVRESTVQIVIMDEKGEVRRVGSGFAVADDGQVLTAAHLVLDERRIVAVPLTTGAELVARVVSLDERTDLALLAVNGLDLPPFKLAKDGFAPGRLVYSAGVWSDSGEPLLVASASTEVPASLAEGAVGELGEVPAKDALPAVTLIEHNAMIPAPGYGGPLLNECGEVVGINRGAPGVASRRLRRGQAPEGATHASGTVAMVALLQPAGVAFIQSDASCAEARAEAEARAAEAQAEAEEAQAQAEEATVEAEEKGQQLEQRQKELETAEERVSELEKRYEEAVRTGAAEADSLRTELESARGEQEAAQTAVANLEDELAALLAQRVQEAEAERRRLIAIVAVAGVLVALIIAVAVVVHRRRSEELAHAQQQAAHAQQEAQRARTEAEAPDFPDCLLVGETGAGLPVSVKLPGSLLAREGAVIGRSPRQATFLVDDKTLSREHARLFGEDGVLYIEDLDTTNGTWINGRRIPSRAPTPLTEGDALELGAVKVQVVWRG